jgi:hypothetical protein
MRAAAHSLLTKFVSVRLNQPTRLPSVHRMRMMRPGFRVGLDCCFLPLLT